MFGNKSDFQQTYPSTQQAVQAQQQSFGVGSALQNLKEASFAAEQAALQLRSTLGISIPESPVQNAPEPSALVDIISTIATRINRARVDIDDSLRYLNS